VADDFDTSDFAAPPPVDSPREPGRGRGSSSGVVGWLIVAVVVIALAIAGGLFTAFIVANMRAVPGPIAGVSPAPSQVAPSTAPIASASESPTGATDAPRRTPTPEPTVEATLPPFVYIVQPGDHLINIADLYQVDIQDVMDLNGIENRNRIFVGQELLIPGYGVPPPTKPPKSPRK
jgi:LysM repeat protein